MAISPCDDYLPVTIFCPCPEVVIISDILCIEAAPNKHLENSKEMVERKFCPEDVPEELPQVLPSTSYSKHFLRYELIFSHSHLAFPQKSPLFKRQTSQYEGKIYETQLVKISRCLL